MTPNLPISRPWFKYVSLAWVFAILAFAIVNWVANEPKAASMNALLEQEFAAVEQLPGAACTHYESGYKPGLATAGCSYSSNATFDEVKRFYDAELARHGWEFCRERALLIMGKEVGAKSIFYRKGELRAAVDYSAGQMSCV